MAATLDQDQKRFVAEKILEIERTPAQWIDFLQTLADYDEAGDARRRNLRAYTWMAGGVGLGGGIILIIVTVIPGAILLGAVAIVFAILLTLYLRQRKL